MTVFRQPTVVAGQPLPDVAAVGRALREAAAVEIMPRFGKLQAHEHRFKGPNDPVTAADEGAERLLAERLGALAPGSLIVGEEGVSVDPARLDALYGEAPVWIIDPVDGTQNFAAGIDSFAVIVAFACRGETLAGWILDPVNDVLAWAVRGHGTWVEGQQARLAPPPPLEDMAGSLGDRIRRRMELAAEQDAIAVPSRWVRYRCCGRDYMDMARGTIHFSRYGGRIKPWDHAAGVLLFEEAGGYARLMAEETVYRPGQGVVEDALLLAPTPAVWRTLHSLLEPR